MYKKMLLLLVGFFLLAGCGDDCSPLPQPKWELPQPIDSLLLGSWEAIEGSLIDMGGSQLITFYENNKYSMTLCRFDNVNEYEYHWSVNGDTLVMPDFYDSRTMRFSDYIYSISADGNLLSVKLIYYPFVGTGPFTAKGTESPFGSKKIFKRLEVE